jgi:hypothetical protein
MESVYPRIYEPELFYAAQEPPPCRLSKEDLSKTPFKNTLQKHLSKTPFRKTLSKTPFKIEPKLIKTGG